MTLCERHSEQLSRDECLALLSPGGIGRIGLSVDALPVLVPVSFAMLEEEIVFGMPSMARMPPNDRAVVLAFLADDLDAISRAGWTVLAQGFAHLVTGNEEIERCRQLGVADRTMDFDPSVFARLTPERLSGRRFRRTPRTRLRAGE